MYMVGEKNEFKLFCLGMDFCAAFGGKPPIILIKTFYHILGLITKITFGIHLTFHQDVDFFHFLA